jgi:hypothetical protein
MVCFHLIHYVSGCKWTRIDLHTIDPVSLKIISSQPLSLPGSGRNLKLVQARSAIIKLQGRHNLYIQLEYLKSGNLSNQDTILIKYNIKLKASLLKIYSDKVNIAQIFSHFLTSLLVLFHISRLHLHLLSILIHSSSLIKTTRRLPAPWPLEQSPLFYQPNSNSNSLSSIHWNKTWGYPMEKLLWTRR